MIAVAFVVLFILAFLTRFLVRRAAGTAAIAVWLVIVLWSSAAPQVFGLEQGTDILFPSFGVVLAGRILGALTARIRRPAGAGRLCAAMPADSAAAGALGGRD